MGVPVPEMNPADDATAEALLSSLRTIAAGERRKHASVFNYWLSIRGDRQFPPIRDLDPLEISDAGPFSVLLEMIGAEDADIRHIGHAIKSEFEVAKLSDAPHPSILSCIAKRVPVVAACRQAFAFEDEFEGPNGKTRCWITLLPFSATGTWIDYVYGFVSMDPSPMVGEEVIEDRSEAAEEVAQPALEPADKVAELLEVATELVNAAAERDEEAQPHDEEIPGPESLEEPLEAVEQESATKPAPVSAKSGKPGFSAKFLESLAAVGGFYGKSVEVEPDLPDIPVAREESTEPEPEFAVVVEPDPEPILDAVPEAVTTPEPMLETEPEPLPAPEPMLEPEPETISQPTSSPEGTLQSKLTEVRTKADEARQAKLRANVALYEGLSAAYDFALDAEDKPDEYLKLVEAQGLKIQLRSPMKPVVRLAFNGMCDDSMIAQLEAVLAWALKQDLPRGSLAERIEAAGGIGPILNGQAHAA